MNRQLSCRAVTATREWLDQVRAGGVHSPNGDPPEEDAHVDSPPTEPDSPDGEPSFERRRIGLGPYIRSTYEGWEPDPIPEEGQRHVVIEGESMGAAATMADSPYAPRRARSDRRFRVVGYWVAQTQSASTRGPRCTRRPKGAHPSCRVGRASRSCLHPSPLKTLGGLDGSGRRRTRKPSPDHPSGRL